MYVMFQKIKILAGNFEFPFLKKMSMVHTFQDHYFPADSLESGKKTISMFFYLLTYYLQKFLIFHFLVLIPKVC